MKKQFFVILLLLLFKDNIAQINFEPIQIDNNEIKTTVTCTTRSYNRSKSNWTIIYNDWFYFFFKFDTDSQKWKLTRTNHKEH